MFRGAAISCLVLLLAFASGCQSGRGGHQPPSKSGTRSISTVHDLVVNGRHVYGQDGKIIPGAVAVSIRSKEYGAAFDVYARPAPESEIGTVAWAILNSSPSYYSPTGWAYAGGVYPTL